MLDRWAYVEFARFEALCFLVGAVLGVVVAIARGERHGNQDATLAA